MNISTKLSELQVVSANTTVYSHISESHLQEWITGSGVCEDIVVANIKTIEKGPEVAFENELFELLYPQPKRLNAGQLNSSHLKLFKNCVETSGWWLSAKHPFRCPIKEDIQWGQFKPDDNTPIKETLDGGKYKSPKIESSVADKYSCIFLNPGQKQWKEIAKLNGLKMPKLNSEDPDFDEGLSFWHWIVENPQIPIYITEGGKKAGCLFSHGQVTIALPGITMWQKDSELLSDIKCLANFGRYFYICFDSDTKPNSRHNCFIQFQKLAQKLEELGCTVWHQEIPRKIGEKVGIDDFLVGGGKLSELKTSSWKNAVPPSLPYGVSYIQGIYHIKGVHHKVPVQELITDLCGNRVLFNYLTKVFVVDGENIEPHLLPLVMEKKFKIYFVNEKQLCEELRTAVHSFSPVASYLKSLPKQDPNYIEEYLRRTLHISDPLQLKMLRKKMIATLKRGSAGEKVSIKDDTALILKGPQGVGKSSFLRILASAEYFCDNVYGVADKDQCLKAHKYWIIEWAELETFIGRRDISLVKSFLSTEKDQIRKPYGITDEEFYRHFSFFGTTNQSEFLTDNTGNRRLWVVEVLEKIDLEYAKANRDKFWGAVKAAAEADESWWFDDFEAAQIEAQSYKYTMKDRDLEETLGPVLADLLNQGLEIVHISSTRLKRLLEKKTIELQNAAQLNWKALKHFMANLGCTYRSSLKGDERGKRGYEIRPTEKVMNLIQSFGLSVKGYTEPPMPKQEIVVETVLYSDDKTGNAAHAAPTKVESNTTCDASNPETEGVDAHAAHVAPVSANFSSNEKQGLNQVTEKELEEAAKLMAISIKGNNREEEEDPLVYYRVGDYVRDIGGGPAPDKYEPDLIYRVEEVLEQPMPGVPGAYGWYMIEDLLDKFRLHKIGGWFLEKVAPDDKQLLEIKDKKTRTANTAPIETSPENGLGGQHESTTSNVASSEKGNSTCPGTQVEDDSGIDKNC